jgi:hypothetical protein
MSWCCRHSNLDRRRWGVDALLGRQTRPHKDLDIALEDQHLGRFERFLALRGYHRTKREIERPFNFVLADHGGREIDVHVISLDENGDGIYGPESHVKISEVSPLRLSSDQFRTLQM